MILVMLAADANLDPHAVWARIQPQAGTSLLRPRPGTVLVGCDVCDQLVHLPETPEGHDACPRCRARLHRRKPDSVGRTSALLLTAAFLYVPANLLPMLSVTYLGWSDTTTILQGIKELVGYRDAAGGDPRPLRQHRRPDLQGRGPRLPDRLGQAPLGLAAAGRGRCSTGSSRGSAAGRWSTSS